MAPNEEVPERWLEEGKAVVDDWLTNATDRILSVRSQQRLAEGIARELKRAYELGRALRNE